MTPAQAAAIARRKNEQEREKAPLLAWAGLGPREVTADEVLHRRFEVVVAMFWSGLELAQRHAQMHALADEVRFEVWTLIEADVWQKVAGWADAAAIESGPGSHAYCRLFSWRRVLALALAGASPVPEQAMQYPSACWEDLQTAIREHRWHDEVRKHDQAGCSKEWCNVSARARPAPIMLGGQR